MKTVKDVFSKYREHLVNVYHLAEIEAITSLVLSDLLDTNKGRLKAFPETNISAQQAERLESIITELKTGKPVQYILGHTEFYGLPFKVTPSVLIPRPETEELVEWVIDTVKAAATPIKNILDIGTGSGCIAITIKYYLPEVELYAVDISPSALVTAKENADLNRTNIGFLEADILNFDYNIPVPKFDIIVSNPPYVTETDKRQMHQNVTDFEPHLALFVPENDPLVFYKANANFALNKLNPGGWLFFEINENYGDETIEMLVDKGFKNIQLRKDLPGRDRMIKANL